jgi:hypothetical protein
VSVCLSACTVLSRALSCRPHSTVYACCTARLSRTRPAADVVTVLNAVRDRLRPAVVVVKCEELHKMALAHLKAHAHVAREPAQVRGGAGGGGGGGADGIGTSEGAATAEGAGTSSAQSSRPSPVVLLPAQDEWQTLVSATVRLTKVCEGCGRTFVFKAKFSAVWDTARFCREGCLFDAADRGDTTAVQGTGQVLVSNTRAPIAQQRIMLSSSLAT